jgi:methylisocitrate lyase
MISIKDMQSRLETCAKARKDPDFVIIARCDELYHLGIGGGGGNSLDEAIKRGHAYLEAGADSLAFPLAAPEATAQLVKAFPKRISTISRMDPGIVCCMHTGWGWAGAAETHYQRARELLNTGTVKFNHAIEDKNALINQDFYDGLIADWARKTGRPTR